jgi:hydroxymethylpyrimidine pyrophosphatase-like HAD family hydrolase
MMKAAHATMNGSPARPELAPTPPLAPVPSDAEDSFYRGYPWCMNVFPTLDEVIRHLGEELDRLHRLEPGWPRQEVMTNVFLLSGAVIDTVDDYVHGDRYDLSRVTGAVPLIGRGVRLVETILNAPRRVRAARVASVRRWRADLATALRQFLTALVGAGGFAPVSAPPGDLAALLNAELPPELRGRRPRVPAAFRTQDLTHVDVLELGRMLVAACPDRQRPILIVGLRTAGSYFAPLLLAALDAEGYAEASAVTIRPKKGLATWEAEALARGAAHGALAVVVDEPVNTGSTLTRAIDVIRSAGFAASDIVALVPVHPSQREWTDSDDSLTRAGTRVLRLEPERWHKQRLLEDARAERLLTEYFGARHDAHVRVVPSSRAERLNAELAQRSELKFHTRLKRIYEVQLQDALGTTETRYVLAKSVGWGWLGYHAFLIGARLSQFVPPLLGLRDGILYTEWLTDDARQSAPHVREDMIDVAASYVAARVRELGLGSDPTPDLGRMNQHNGLDVLAGALGRAYGGKAAALKRSRIRCELSRHACPSPTLIDGKMREEEWITTAATCLKTDFEHHGLGKTELNMTDPAYDLAEAMLAFRLSEAEERRLIDRYVDLSGDARVGDRLFLNKLLAGIWAMTSAVSNLGDARLSHRHDDFNRQYIDAWNFLTIQTMRHCASACRRPPMPQWRTPLVVLDVDGVLDKQIFGFPSTTAAGIRAVSLLHAHEIAVALNTARTLTEVQEYCRAYGFVGGVAEYGAIVWDAVNGRERVLVGDESRRQLERVRLALQAIPGVFLNDDYRYSLRAYTYERGTTVALPTMLIRQVLRSVGADRLDFHQTYLDTAVLAKETDKGRGLHALLALSGNDHCETIAVGDSDADLAMFRVARRAFAPSHIGCRSAATRLGCRIADRAFQPGLLAIARSIVHADGERCEVCRACDGSSPRRGDLFWTLLEAADQSGRRQLVRALLDPMVLHAFVK